MKKVYVIEYHNYEDSNIDGVYLSKDNALKHIEDLKKKEDDKEKEYFLNNPELQNTDPLKSSYIIFAKRYESLYLSEHEVL